LRDDHSQGATILCVELYKEQVHGAVPSSLELEAAFVGDSGSNPNDNQARDGDRDGQIQDLFGGTRHQPRHAFGLTLQAA